MAIPRPGLWVSVTLRVEWRRVHRRNLNLATVSSLDSRAMPRVAIAVDRSRFAMAIATCATTVATVSVAANTLCVVDKNRKQKGQGKLTRPFCLPVDTGKPCRCESSDQKWKRLGHRKVRLRLSKLPILPGRARQNRKSSRILGKYESQSQTMPACLHG